MRACWQDPAPRFIVVGFDERAITVRLRVHATYADFFDLGYDLNRRLKKALDDHMESSSLIQNALFIIMTLMIALAIFASHDGTI